MTKEDIVVQNARALNDMLRTVQKKHGSAFAYSNEDIDFVLDLLEKNKFNIKKTAIETKVDGKTIKVWYNRRVMAATRKKLEEDFDKATENQTIEQIRETYEREVINAKRAILQLIVENLSNLRSHRALLTTLRAINDSAQTPGVTASASKTPAPQGGSILQVLTQQATINTGNNESKNNRAIGDSEEPAG